MDQKDLEYTIAELTKNLLEVNKYKYNLPFSNSKSKPSNMHS